MALSRINSSMIGAGDVSNTEHAYLNSVTSNVQTQIDGAGLTQGTATASTSGTAITFTGIPSGTKRIVFSFNEVSSSGTSLWHMRIGDAGGIETVDYEGNTANGGGTDLDHATNDGHVINNPAAAAQLYSGVMEWILVDSSTNTWVSRSVVASEADCYYGGGSKSLSAELTQVQLTTAGGSDTFDAGKVNIQYEL